MFTRNRREATDAPLDERVTSVLAAAAAPTEPGPVPGETEALAAFRASSQAATRRPSMLSSLMTVKATAAAALSAGVLLTGSIGAAAAGVLPAGAQDSASEILSKVGVTVPDGAGRSGEHADGGESAEEHAEGAKPTDANAKGESVSGVAKSDELSGVEKGAAVSGTASDGKSHAGENSGDGSARPEPAEGKPTKPTQGDGAGDAAEDAGEAGEAGAGAASNADASEGRSDDVADEGAEKAGESSGGQSIEGSTNRP